MRCVCLFVVLVVAGCIQVPSQLPVTNRKPAPKKVSKQSSQDEAASANIRDRLSRARKARCKTALCWGGSDSTELALEPIGEIPVGKTFTPDFFRPRDGLAGFVNNHDVSLTLAAGMRFWFYYDVVSLSVYFSTPLLDGDATIRLDGSTFEHPFSRVRRPFPGIGIGLFGDIMWVGLDYNELRNGDSDMGRDPDYPRNAVIDRALTITVGIAPITLARTGLGAKK